MMDDHARFPRPVCTEASEGVVRREGSRVNLSIGGMASSPSTPSPAPRRPSYRDVLLGSPQPGAEATTSPQSRLDDERIAGAFADVADLTATMQIAKRKSVIRKGTTALSPHSHAASTSMGNKDETGTVTSPGRMINDVASPPPSTVSTRTVGKNDMAAGTSPK